LENELFFLGYDKKSVEKIMEYPSEYIEKALNYYKWYQSYRDEEINNKLGWFRISLEKNFLSKDEKYQAYIDNENAYKQSQKNNSKPSEKPQYSEKEKAMITEMNDKFSHWKVLMNKEGIDGSISKLYEELKSKGVLV